MTDELEALRGRIEALEQRVDELESEPTNRSGGVGGIDRYDGYVLDRIEDLGVAPDPRTMVRLYNEAGIRDAQKIKARHRFLRRSGRIEQAVENGTDTEG